MCIRDRLSRDFTVLKQESYFVLRYSWRLKWLSRIAVIFLANRQCQPKLACKVPGRYNQNLPRYRRANFCFKGRFSGKSKTPYSVQNTIILLWNSPRMISLTDRSHKTLSSDTNDPLWPWRRIEQYICWRQLSKRFHWYSEVCISMKFVILVWSTKSVWLV